MNEKNVIFDLDGTLIDPSSAICNSINYALIRNGHPKVNPERLLPYIGRHLFEPFKDVTGRSENDYLWELINTYRERYETIGIKENELYPGIGELLSGLATRNYIASIKPWHACRLILKELKIENYFAGVYGSETDGTRSDKTELLHYIKDVESISKAVMVGDRDSDIYAAKSCGFASIAVTYGYGSHEELKAANPDIIVKDSEGLKTALEEIWTNYLN